MVLYQECEFHRRRLAQLEQPTLETQNQTDAETNIPWAQLSGLRQEIEWDHQHRERLEDQMQVTGAREEKAQKELQASKERVATLTGEMTLFRKQVGDLEHELAYIRKTLLSLTRTESSTSGKAEAASSKTMTSSIAQMTIGTTPALAATSTTCQAAATLASTTTAVARSQPSTYGGYVDVATTAAQPVVQTARVRTQHPYLHRATHTFRPGIHLIGECTPTHIPRTCRRCQPCQWEETWQ